MTWEKRVLPARRGRRALQEKGDEKEMPICGGLPPGGVGPLLPPFWAARSPEGREGRGMRNTGENDKRRSLWSIKRTRDSFRNTPRR